MVDTINDAECVHVSYLQRFAKAPRLQEARQLNRLLSWIKSNLTALGIRFKRLAPPLRLVCISDSAFKALEFEGLAMRGYVAVLVSADAEPLRAGQDLNCAILDFYSRKQQHVVRSTFAAELHALLDACSQAALLAVTLTEVIRGGSTAGQLLQWQRMGDFAFPTDAVIDAKAVFDALNAEVVKTPAERHLLLPLLAAKELLDRGELARLLLVRHEGDAG